MNSTKIALVTGANKGIGLETVRQLAANGITVLLAARDEQRGGQAADKLKQEGLDVRFLQLDVNDTASQDNAAKFIAENFGRLDILVNNAGIFQEPGVPASQGTLEQWRATFETNVFSLVSLTQKLLPLVKKSEAGRIVNLTSILGSLAMHSNPKSPIAGASSSGSAYNASKAAVNMFTVNLANELKGTPIKVNAAHPGWVKTDMGGEEAPLDVTEGAKTSVALALLPEDGPTGGYFHLGQTLPW
ncbi:MAG TPA: SDR family oxidoreductase [Blastocatellia bacterium]|nr:SDR family oxidoreductase [Blastocatellia bacterium]HMX26319.1 SDR family oxidoreductase [Blastocatellia bacterium]HMY75015.1 SDR family oxidoreductase [Blastocatellia bacterium]HMZ22279.1 SDR family oxidoreductase [Blastocatellia bacterium]